MDFWLILGSKIDEKSMKNRSKNISKIRCDSPAHVLTAGGRIFFTFSLQDGSWMSFGVDLEAKLGPSWDQVGIKINKKRCQKKNEKRLHLEGILKASWRHLGAKMTPK